MYQPLIYKPIILLLTSLLLGMGLVFAFAPFNLPLVAPLVIACFYLLCKGAGRSFKQKKQYFFLGWSFGFGLFASGCYWIFISIYNFTEAGLIASALLVGLLCLILGIFYGLFVVSFVLLTQSDKAGHQCALKNKSGFRDALVFSSLFVLFAYLRGWIPGGFPWLYLGYSQIDTLLAGYAPILGVLGIDWLLVFIAVLSAQLLINLKSISTNKRQITLALLSIGLVYTGGYYLKSINWTQTDLSRPPLEIISVQPNIAQNIKWSAEQAAFVRNRLLQLSFSGLNSANQAGQTHQADETLPKLVLWPESALPSYWSEEKKFLQNSVRMFPAHSWLLTGIISRQKQDWLNSIVLMHAEKPAHQFYHKRRLVPFGEFIPFSHGLTALTQWLGVSFPISNLKSGADKQADLMVRDLMDASYSIAPFICYEIVFPDLVAQSMQNSNYLLTISNDAWFGRSIGPHQHMQIARMRALENGLPLIRVTNTGMSAITDYKGKIISSLPAYVPGVDYYSLAPQKGRTPFHYLQSRAIVLWSLFLILALFTPFNILFAHEF